LFTEYKDCSSGLILIGVVVIGGLASLNSLFWHYRNGFLTSNTSVSIINLQFAISTRYNVFTVCHIFQINAKHPNAQLVGQHGSILHFLFKARFRISNTMFSDMDLSANMEQNIAFAAFPFFTLFPMPS
jgi:hypothetical protein